MPAGPGLDLKRDGCAPDFLDPAVDTQCVADLDRLFENDLVDCHGNGASASHVVGTHESRKVHLRHDPAAENVAGRIGVGWHCKRSQCQFHIGGRLLVHLPSPFINLPLPDLNQPPLIRQ
ncbi:Hypothetical protein AT6N2_L1369 [Agrobacterium tumefaciens]|nr:Hypothetical protein AT6N2_L1369 [Agrobacterium tumefaciens]